MTLRDHPAELEWSSLRFRVNGEIFAGKEGLDKWEQAKKDANVLQDYIEVTNQYSAKYAEIATL